MLRIWPRACQISKGIAGLRFLLKGNNKHQLDLHVSQMKYTGLNDVVDQLQGCVRGTCPSREGILGAMAADIGKASGNDLERVCTGLHVDEHQLRYGAVTRRDDVESHGLSFTCYGCTFPGWYHDHNVFFIPFLTGRCLVGNPPASSSSRGACKRRGSTPLRYIGLGDKKTAFSQTCPW